MAMDAMVFQQDWFGYNSKDDLLPGGNLSYGFGFQKQHSFQHFPGNQTSDTYNLLHGDWVSSTSSQASMAPALPHSIGPSASVRPRKRRPKTEKNKQEMENQRMNHIAVERNRRKQMNRYLSSISNASILCSKGIGDQASIVGGAINFVKELEQRLQWLSTKKEVKEERPTFAEFFTLPQFSTSSSSTRADDNSISANEFTVEIQRTIADIEVNVIENHANLKIRRKRLPSQLLKLVSGLNAMRLTILHLSVTSAARTVLYSFSLKVEDDCKVTTVDGIDSAVNLLLCRIQDDVMLNSMN
ncbi:hypothetical protein V6N12_015583 [Hibiscus sabdariffa]|uniref:BHLH domain-containing protein n=1 Tax=Hibiscus sabdariffa TaxID=183260 RepID=A0ABR2DP13_9ROSI